MLAIRPLEKNDKTYEKWDKSIWIYWKNI
jgi:hypothetical protein